MTEDEKKAMQFVCGQNAALVMMFGVLFQSLTLAFGKSPSEIEEQLSSLGSHFAKEEVGDSFRAGFGAAIEAVRDVLRDKPGYSS